MTESELAVKVIQWLSAQGWECYQEVQPFRYGRTCDIVAKQKGLIWAIECKLTLSLALMEQAWWWIGSANFISVAIPQIKYTRGSAFAGEILRNKGIGIIWVPENYDISTDVCMPMLSRRTCPILKNALREDQKTFASAGNADGARWTPYAQTCKDLMNYVGEHPGCPVKDAIDGIKHHYHTDATARSCIMHWAKLGRIKGIELRIENGKARLYRKDNSNG